MYLIDPARFVRDPSRSMLRDGIIFVATLLAIGATIGIVWAALVWPYKVWGLPYIAGFLVGCVLLNIVFRLRYGFWP